MTLVENENNMVGNTPQTGLPRTRAIRRGCASLVWLVVLPVWGVGLARADYSLSGLSASVQGGTVTYQVGVCAPATGTVPLGIYHDLAAAPAVGSTPDRTVQATAGPSCPINKLTWGGAPVGLHRSYAMVDPAGKVAESNEGNNAAGPVEVCVGADLRLSHCALWVTGAELRYKASVCNLGSAPAQKFRVGFFHDYGVSPPSKYKSDLFGGVSILHPGYCTDVVASGERKVSGNFKAWCQADNQNFVLECQEDNNNRGPLPYTLSYADLAITSLRARTRGPRVEYTVKVCNEGPRAATKFFVDIYFQRYKRPPTIGSPGDMALPVAGLATKQCTTLVGLSPPLANNSYGSWALADADDYVAETDEADNLSGVIVVVGGGGGKLVAGCEDLDGDGHGRGAGCSGQLDCDDQDSKIHPGATEVCHNGVDEDCDMTPDDGCPGSACTDLDGDGFGTGKCALVDCDDTDATVHPFAAEKCGDNKDDNCNKIADDGCPGRQCRDLDGDGYGVGAGCPGPQDCADGDPLVHPKAKEVCGDGVDNDCDGTPEDGCSGALDGDNDGHAVGGGAGRQRDCDDRDASIYPGAKEVCGDGKDNDCDGTVDDGCPGVRCVDHDGDGWGVGPDCKRADCDDTRNAVFPWAAEACDGVDNDCDGTVDEGCPASACKDLDGDGFGAGAGCCNAPGATACRQGCDDSDGGVHPWAAEICFDSADNNCDGQKDEGCTLCRDADGDGHGIGARCSNWDCDDGAASTYPGASETCDGVDNDCDGVVDDDCVGCGCGAPGGRAGPRPGVLLLLILAALMAVRVGRGPRRTTHGRGSGPRLQMEKDR